MQATTDWPDPIPSADGETSFPESFNPHYDDPAVQELDMVCAEEAYGPTPATGT